MVHIEVNKPHTSDLIKFRNNLVLSKDEDDKELLMMINKGEVELSYINGRIVIDEV